jgi:hypothetical protein
VTVANRKTHTGRRDKINYKVKPQLTHIKIAKQNEVKETTDLHAVENLKLKDYHVGEMKVCQLAVLI